MKPIIIILWAGIILLSACSSNQKETQFINENASLPALFKFSDAGLKMTASFIDKRSGSMSVLYRKDETWTLVTWKQKSDESWFGANVPGGLLSVEIVKLTASGSGLPADYKNYNGKGLVIIKDTAWQKSRLSYILGQQPSVMP